MSAFNPVGWFEIPALDLAVSQQFYRDILHIEFTVLEMSPYTMAMFACDHALPGCGGALIVGPNKGEMACGEFGPGRMAEPLEIVAAIEALLNGAQKLLAGKRVIVTSGPTHEPIDPVRYIANRSSGKQGFAIAAAAAALGARVTLVAGPVALKTPAGVRRIDVESARDMAEAVRRSLPADVAVMVAAVADWRPKEYRGEKIKKRGDAPPALMLTENPDILTNVAGGAKRPALVIGFAAETDNVVEHARQKRKRKSADWIVANDVSGDVMGGDRNRVHIISNEGVETLEEMPKSAVAMALAERIAAAFQAEVAE